MKLELDGEIMKQHKGNVGDRILVLHARNLGRVTMPEGKAYGRITKVGLNDYRVKFDLGPTYWVNQNEDFSIGENPIPDSPNCCVKEVKK